MSDKAELVQEILHSLRRLFQVANEHSKKVERQTGLTGPQLWAIKIIAQEESLMVSELARRMCLHPATVVGILDRLEKQKFVVRVRAVDDRRIVRIALTANGKSLLKKSPQVAQGLFVSGLEKLELNDLKKITFGLAQMAIILGAQGIPPRIIALPKARRNKREPGLPEQAAVVRSKAGGRYERVNHGARALLR